MLKERSTKSTLSSRLHCSIDLNGLRHGKDVKNGLYDVEHLYNPLKGVEIGYAVCTLTNLTNFSVGDVRIYSKNKSKKEIWEEMVMSNPGTINGKIKVIIADDFLLTITFFYH